MNKYAGMVLVCSMAMGGAQAGELDAKASQPMEGVPHIAAPTLKLMGRASGIRVKSVILRDARARSEKPVKPGSPTAMSEGGLCMPESNQVCPVPEDDPWLQINWYFDYFNDALSRWEVAEVRQKLDRVEVTATKPDCRYSVVGPRSYSASMDCGEVTGFQDGMDGDDRAALLGKVQDVLDYVVVAYPLWRDSKKYVQCFSVSQRFSVDQKDGFVQAADVVKQVVRDDAVNGDKAEVKFTDGVHTFEVSRHIGGGLQLHHLHAGGGAEPRCR
ncbi:MAG: hypothetical protein J0L58_18955 [Burkholderiales bacterium]|nr:hypothetical protein [Burkholderiales bacterium]